jgi:ABC-2 type transport system ATP-binding protein
MIRLVDVQKKLGAQTAVERLDLHVPRGEFFGLLGHNGAGKSTAIGMMLGQVWPTAGEIKICGFNVAAQRQKALQHVGAIFETPVFYDYLSAWQNLEIFSHYTAPTPPARIREVIEWVGLTGREKSRVKTFSHGMRARLALAQALLPQPQLLILDEPSDGLDPECINEMRQTIQRLHGELGLTILLSSHLLNEVEQLCTRIAVLNHGQKVFEGTMAETMRKKTRVRLVVNDFAAATTELRATKLISDSAEGKFISLADGVQTNQIVGQLVLRGMDVFEIAPEAQTLEDFYLSLMKQH